MAIGRVFGAAVTVKASSGVDNTVSAHNSFPSVVKKNNGDLVCIYRQSKSHLVPASAADTDFRLKTSTDNGATWGAESVTLTDSTYDLRTNITRLDPKTGDLVMIYYGDELTGTNDPRSFFRRSTDGGATWSSAVAFTTANTGYGYNWIAASDLLIVQDANASYGYTFYATFYGVDAVGSIGTAYSRLVKSTDGGATWSAVSTIQTAAQTSGVQNGEPQLVKLSTGRWLCITRVQTATLSYWMNYSDDSGATWSAPASILTNITNQPVCWQTPQGDIVLMGSDQAGGTGVMYSFSTNDGTTWSPLQNTLQTATYAMNGGMWVQLSNGNTDGALGLAWAEETNPTRAHVFFRTAYALPVSEFVNDTFTDSSGTTLTSHTGEIGATWTRMTQRPNKTLQISNANRCRSNSTGDDRVGYYTSAVPATADYDVEATMRRFDATINEQLGVAGRVSTSAEDLYYVNWVQSAAAWKLGKFVAGAETYIASYSATPATSTDTRIRLMMRGTTIRMFIDAVERGSATDSDISAAGRAGISGYWNAAGSDITGQHLDSFIAAQMTSGLGGSRRLTLGIG